MKKKTAVKPRAPRKTAAHKKPVRKRATTDAPAKKLPFRMNPEVEAEVRRVAREEAGKVWNERSDHLLAVAEEKADLVVGRKGGAIMNFFAEILQEGIDLDGLTTGKKKDGTFVSEFHRIFLLGLRAREKRDTRTVQEAQRIAGGAK